MTRALFPWTPALAAASLALAAAAGAAQDRPGPPAPAIAPAVVGGNLTYADLVDLADPATLVVRAQVRTAVRLSPAQAPGLRPGHARFFVEARTRALLVGSGVGESIRYLADVPLDRSGRAPGLRKREVLVFARPVPGRPGEVQLVAPDAQVMWNPPLEARVRAVLTELVAPGAAPPVLGVREAMHVAGNLVGEGETQIFLATARGDPVSITVLRRPAVAPAWGVALGEIVDQAARPPRRETLGWYRLACFLPDRLPPAAILAGGERERRSAEEDYRFVRAQLGACPRARAPAARIGLAPPRPGA